MRALFEVEPETGPELPDLQGSPKQIDWAIKIRSAILPKLDRAVREWQRRVRDLQIGGDPDKRAKAEARLGRVIQRVDEIRAISHAAWWIERRENDVTELIDNGPAKPGGGYR